ncbi:protein kinase [Luteolibacter arcticus]|uniref:Protein kinase n=1 Tax=Luteolibacter arcticus TaxID=1581411 RepID=A0ABT3GEE4_9BACT|nr:serine/threonine-protein kinase [Luteolibacter arcticus]MCW1921987.1 protein kinase [Luteolibacter arcticus]
MTEKTCPTCHRPLPPDAPLCPVCVLMGAREEGAPAGVPPLEEIQAAFPELEVLECIGRGGMGIVYKARQPHLDRLIALKILAPELSADPGFAERFSREALTLAKLSHPHIVGIHDYGQRGDFCYLLMEYVDGVNLRQAMRAARFTPEQALALVPDLCAALQFAHDHGVLHRDIKPENILIDTRGRVRIVDFGIAQLLSEGPSHLTLTATGSALGSAAYMAPEQIEGGSEIDHRADIYSLGVVFYEMLTGGLPLGRFPLPSEKSTASVGIDDVVLRALEKERERRYQSADAVRSGLNDASSQKPKPPTPAKLAPEHSQERLTLWSLGLLGGGLITAAVGFATSPVILGLGTVAGIFGLLGCWWLLIGMRTGRYQTTRRKLLLAVAFFPVVIGMLWLLVIVPLVRGFTDVIYSQQPWPLLWILIPFALAVIVGKLLWKPVNLPAPGKPSYLRHFKRWAPVAGTGALLVSLVIGKHFKAQLDPLSKYYSASFQLREAKGYGMLSEEDATLAKEAAIQAAGEYAGFYQVEFPPYRPDSVSIGFTGHGRWWGERAMKHIASYEQRLLALLPSRIRIEPAGDGVHANEVNQVHLTTERTFSIALVVFLGIGSFLMIFAGRRAFVISLALGTIATVILHNFPKWPTPSILPPSLEGRPPLPELPLHEENFGSPEGTVDTLIRAAALRNAPTFLKAFQADELGAEHRARLLELMPFFAICTRKAPETGDSPDSAKVDLTFWSHRYPPKPRMREGFSLPLKIEQGEWKIPDIARQLDYLKGRAVGPYFKSEY